MSAPERAIDVTAAVFGDWRKPAPAAIDVSQAPEAADARCARGADDEQGTGGHRLRLHVDPASGPGVLRVLVDEQHPRTVRAWRAARRQHPRTAGHGVLHVQLARRQPGSRSVDRSRRRQPGKRRACGGVDRRGAVETGGGGTDRQGARRVEAVPDRLDAANSRNQRRHCDVSADRGVVRARARLRRRAPVIAGRVTREQVHDAARAVLNPSRATVVVAGPYSGELQ